MMSDAGDRLKKARQVTRRLARLAVWPMAFVRYTADKWEAYAASRRMVKSAERLRLLEQAVRELKEAWAKQAGDATAEANALMEAAQHEPGTPGHADKGGASGVASAPGAGGAWSSALLPGLPLLPTPTLGERERAILHRVRERTRQLNRNNVTRTEAYRAIYFRTPELHWALLAHMVSRNGGWNMSDLQGEMLPRLLGLEQREATFLMLERANALIFHDAYPQLLLYEEGKRLGRDLSGLLPALGVSSFMVPVWKQFGRKQDPVPLTVALIVNEQHYIEKRVVRNPMFRQSVLDTMFFGLQSLLQLNQVVFPYGVDFPIGERSAPIVFGRERNIGTGEGLRLAGLILEDFDSLRERIEFGKRLYALLFGIPAIRKGVHRFAKAVRHTASRADYAPELFAPVRQRHPQRPYRPRLDGLRLRPGAEPLYSPNLGDAWSDREVGAAEPGDWFAGETGNVRHVERYFRTLPLPAAFEITNEYGFALGKLELAAIAAEGMP
ncbi:hypothetical protein BG53_09225 [Paenibacillus darwinianus]|uniref:DUF2515 domain-containing protein n=3 Tax=Paenibacillus darwinianus TaxID=1380763 RepID=A0A9W5RYX2_9BACL|nr:hypothetical protein BG53_09225 [Paenibacillus darwinianus]